MAENEKEGEITEVLKRSKDIVGYQQPVIIDKNTLEIVDGRHRKQADPGWPEVYREFKNQKERLLYRIHANIIRRTVTRKERASQICELASYLEEEGVPAEQISQRIIELVPSLSPKYLINLLPARYKSHDKRRAGVKSAEKRKRKELEIRVPEKETAKSIALSEPRISEKLSIQEMDRISPAEAIFVEKPIPKETTIEKPIPKSFVCPRCHVEVGTLYCTKCFSELNVKDIAKILRRPEG